MNRKRFEVRRGDTVTVGLPVQPAVQPIQRKGEEGSKLVNPGEQEDDLYVTHRSGIQVFDLGLELLSYSAKTYRDIELSRIVPLASVLDTSWRAAYLTNLFKFYLGGSSVDLNNPDLQQAFGKTQGITNRRILDLKSDALYVDVVLTQQDDQVKKVALGKPDRPYVDQLDVPGASNAESSPLWNNRGLSAEVRKMKALHVESVGYFYDFDTADTVHYKITNDPSYSADEVLVDLSKLSSLYLAPLINDYTYFYNFRIITADALPPVDVYKFAHSIESFGGGAIVGVPTSTPVHQNIIDNYVNNVGFQYVIGVQLGYHENTLHIKVGLGTDPLDSFMPDPNFIVGEGILTGRVVFDPNPFFAQWFVDFRDAGTQREIVDIVPGLTVGLNPNRYPQWIFDGNEDRNAGVSSTVYVQSVGGSPGPGFPILETSFADLYDLVSVRRPPFGIVYRGTPFTDLPQADKDVLIAWFLQKAGSILAPNENAIFVDRETNHYLSYPRPFTRSSTRDDGYLTLNQNIGLVEGQLVGVFVSDNSKQYIWIKSQPDFRFGDGFVQFPAAAPGIVIGRIEDGSRFTS